MNLIGNVDVSRETYERLRAFEALILKWSPRINLVSRDTVDDIWQRHILDSAQLFDHLPDDAAIWTDIGSGGGLPGVVAAIILADRAPDTRLTMIESDQRKATFLRTAIRECGAQARVLTDRIENAPSQGSQVLTARAVAPLAKLLPLARHHMVETGVALLHKGRNYTAEIDEARKDWTFTCIEHASLTAPDARILEIREINRAIA